MLNFRLGKIPIQVHFTHLLFAAFLGWGTTPFGSAWLAAELADAGHANHDNARLIWTAIFVAMAFISILVHELGHAVVSLAFGYKPDIQIAWIGGRTSPNANESIPWLKNLALTAAGPLFGFMLGLACAAVALVVPKDTPADAIFTTLAVINVIWAIFNLLPIYPMDGGQLTETLLRRIFGRVGFLLAQVVTLGTIALLIAFALAKWGSLGAWNMMLAALLGMRSVQAIQGYLRGELPVEPNHPSELAFRQAVQLYTDNKLEASRRVVTEALKLEMTPALLGRFSHLLGWIAVKEGLGRQALDHFSQATGVRVEPQALAAAFSLVGDEARALPLWEAAAKESNDPTLLHEWAGSLIRAGRDDEARAMKGVEMATAYRCAERLLFVRGEFAAAARAGLEGLDLRPSANAAYDVACAFARANDKEQATAVLRRAMELGFRDFQYASTDSDLATLHSHRPFLELLTELRSLPAELPKSPPG